LVRAGVILLLCVVLSSVAHAEARFALLIGNQSYDPSVGMLRNPHNDIALVGDALAKQGFELLPPVKDGKRSAILGAVRDLVRRLNSGGSGAIGFIYYSGHGAAEKDTNINYLIPIDAKDPGTTAFWDESVKLDDVLRLLDGARLAAKFVVFDACRNELQLPSKDTSKGLVPVAEQQGMFIAYASAPGRTASDRGEKSGPYAAALAVELGKPGLDHLNLFQNVKETVLASTGNAQQPWESNGLGRRVYLTGTPPRGIAVGSPQANEAERTWRWVKDTESQSVLESFIKEFGSTPFGAMASARLADLRSRESATATPPKVTPPPTSAPTSHPEPGSLAHSLVCRTARGRDDCERAGCAWIGSTCITGTAMQIDPSQPALSLTPKPTPVDCNGVKTQVGNERRCLKPGDSFKDCLECPEMVVIPAGEFMMGSPTSEPERPNNEGPQHKVMIRKTLAVGKFEVTFAELDACAAGGGCKYKPDDRAWGRSRRPVVNMSWDDITKEYLPWLSRKTGREYRLLTEAEWEYGARAGTSTAFSTGATITTDQANFDGTYTYGGSVKGQFRQKTVEVGLFKPNGFGLYDMHGNVGEWVADCYKDSYSGAPVDGSAVTSGDCPSRVHRGGSWGNRPRDLRSAARNGYSPDGRYGYLGFRVARTLSP
jgi:formylglycine-generating enzyme required for sulfatase activity